MGDTLPGSTCAERLGPDWIDDGTTCRMRCNARGPTGLDGRPCRTPPTEPDNSPSFLETVRQQAIIGSIIGIRKGLGAVNPAGIEAVTRDETTAYLLLARGDYERAFEVATGLVDYFDIHKQGRAVGADASETAAVMMGHATGFNQAAATVTGQSRSGETLQGFERVLTGLDAVLRIANTTLTVVGGVQSLGLGSRVTVVSPVYRIAGRDIVIVETSVGRQAFYRSSGVNSGSAGKWFPVDEILHGWFNKAAYTEGPGLGKGARLHRLGTEEFARISKRLGEMSIPEGQHVPAGAHEAAEMTLNRILDFFRARTTPTTVIRPVQH